MRFLYSLLWWIALPFVLIRLYTRGKKEPGYRQHIGQRLGFYEPVKKHSFRIWVHAVSVGETRAAEPLVRALLERFASAQILLTCMTPTGRQTGAEIFKEEIKNERLYQVYLPYDTRMMMRRFLNHFMPRICILLETEIWPNLIDQCKKHDVALVLANARLSQRSLKKGKKFESIMRHAASCFDAVAAQTQTDAKRLRYFSEHNVMVTGSVKFDVVPSQSMIKEGESLRKMINQRPVLMCASTRLGEEKLIIEALQQLDANALVILVPRHPQRFNDVAELLEQSNISYKRRSQIFKEQINSDWFKQTRVLLGDSMGEMFMYYAACDIAFIGGSLVPLGGQNLIESCAIGKPVLVGEHTFNFEAITQDAVSDGCAIRVHSASELMKHANELFQNEALRLAMGNKASAFAHAQRGATERTMALILPLIEKNNQQFS